MNKGNTIKVSVVVIGPDRESVTSAQTALAEQTLQPCEVMLFTEPMPDQLRNAIRNIRGDYVYVMRFPSGFKTRYSLEKQVLERVLGHESGEVGMPVPCGLWNVVLTKGELHEDVAELLAWPEDVPAEEQSQPLSEAKKRSLAGVARGLWPLDAVPLSGAFFRLVHQLAQVYRDEADQRFLCALLHVAEYKNRREFLSDEDWKGIRYQLDVLHNLAWEDVTLPDVCVSERIVQSSAPPLLTYIVPVYNVGRYLSRCLESLRRQTMRNIEIICIDDGSYDDSADILDAYARRDGRIRVFHKVHEGVGIARNLAMSIARGTYVSFVDGDDWLESETAEVAVREANCHALDFCTYDIVAFNHKTRNSIPIYWSIAAQSEMTPTGCVMHMQDFRHLMINASACLSVYRKSFLDRVGFRFKSLKLGEDLTFTMTIWPLAKRFMLLNRAFYHYRRGQPCSAVSNLTAGVGTRSADAAQIAMMEALLRLYRDVYKNAYSEKAQQLFRERILADVLYYAERAVAVRAWLADGGWAGFDFDFMDLENLEEVGLADRWEEMRRRMCASERMDRVACGEAVPFALKLKVARIERCRRKSPKDLYIVTGQLNSRTNEPIDSWTFFAWLQRQGIPSRYVIWKEHAFYEKLRDCGMLKDVIVMDGDSVGDYEFVSKCAKALVRAKAVIQENAALNCVVRAWLKGLAGCDYVFLQHGVFYTWFAPVAAKTLDLFNHINVASVRERDFILNRMPDGTGLTEDSFIVGGLPRWDALEDQSGATSRENIILVMLTWRSSFDQGMERIRKSAYFHRLKDFLSFDNLKRFAAMGVRIVLAPHHHLANSVKQLDFGVPVEIVSTANVSDWIRRAKMLVTDFSSVSIDFLFQSKPVVYWMLDADDLLLDRAITNDGGKVVSAEKEVRELFNQVFSVSDMMALIEHYANNGFVLEPEKKAVAETFFAHKRDVCKHLYESLEAVAEKNEEKEVQR